MKPAAGFAVDILGDVGGKGDDIMVQRALEFLASVEAERGLPPALDQVARAESNVAARE